MKCESLRSSFPSVIGLSNCTLCQSLRRCFGGFAAFSRIDYETGTEIVVAINAETEPRRINVAVDGRAQDFTALLGQCSVAVTAPTSYTMTIPALDAVVCKTEFGAE